MAPVGHVRGIVLWALPKGSAGLSAKHSVERWMFGIAEKGFVVVSYPLGYYLMNEVLSCLWDTQIVLFYLLCVFYLQGIYLNP